jgi:hypothetical protein
LIEAMRVLSTRLICPRPQRLAVLAEHDGVGLHVGDAPREQQVLQLFFGGCALVTTLSCDAAR